MNVPKCVVPKVNVKPFFQVTKTYQNDFAAIYNMINDAKFKVWLQVNNSLITLYWNVGRYVSEKVEKECWGKSVVMTIAMAIITGT